MFDELYGSQRITHTWNVLEAPASLINADGCNKFTTVESFFYDGTNSNTNTMCVDQMLEFCMHPRILEQGRTSCYDGNNNKVNCASVLPPIDVLDPFCGTADPTCSNNRR